jgi:uncharacterized 2Fe-2S/4Fe-4S cluster protein (DUF4445 family)
VPRISFITEGREVVVEKGLSILEGARAAGVVIESPCGALGTCGKCKVKIPNLEDLQRLHHRGTRELPEAETHEGYVLACQTEVLDDVSVVVKDYAEENKSLRILAGGSSFDYELLPFITKRTEGSHTAVYGGGELLGTEDGDTRDARYGLAVDIGTTTLVAALVDLSTGKELASDSVLNPQSRYAQDVLSRIHFASNAEGLETLRKSLNETLHAMIGAAARQAGIRREHIYEAVFSGNTTMLHLACGEDPRSLGQYPYTPRLWGHGHVPAEGLGLSAFAEVYLPPIISAYVGADITSGILASRLSEAEGTTLFIDVGTNGEIVLARNGELAASSTAAGPAFEGMNISCGMRASAGSIEAFHINEDGSHSFKVIGSGKAVGICGSGLLDISGELARTGIIGTNGRFTAPDGPLRKHLREKDGKKAFFITDEVYLSQKDVRQIQLAKGAIRTGIEMLLSRFNIAAPQVDSVRIAGSFGYHLCETSLLNTGLLPRAFAGKVSFAGNTSMSGAAAFLLNTGFREKMKKLVKRIDKVELAGDPAFEKTFIRNLGF